jgi:organic hydroperoxide reductase OsmC/OhrA
VAREHVFTSRSEWRGSTAGGWDSYDRTHHVTAPPASPRLTVTTADERVGDPRHMNPEQLLLAAVSSCQLLWFLHLAAVARIDVLEYVDEAKAVMPEENPPVRITAITLRPRVVVAKGPSEQRVTRLMELAHRECYIANSLRSEVLIEPEVIIKEETADDGRPREG